MSIHKHENRIHKKPQVIAKMLGAGDAETIRVSGQVARTLDALVNRGGSGVTALEVSCWAFRLGAYIYTLRHEYGLSIETHKEEHEGGWHARYVLTSPVEIIKSR